MLYKILLRLFDSTPQLPQLSKPHSLSGVRYENESQRLPLLAANFIIQVNLPRRCLEKLAR